MTATAQAVLNAARSQLGMTEVPFGSNRTPYGKWYGLDGNAWCDMFVSWCANQAGASDIVGKFAYTPSHAQWFNARGRFGHEPRVGAIVFFAFSPGTTRWLGISHVGIVESVIDGGCIAIEGNTDAAGGRTGGKVMRQARRSRIAGYGYPEYLDAPAAPPAPSGVAVDGEWGPATTRALQAALKVTVDGEFGPNSTRALQRRVGSAADGQMGPNTIRALQRYVTSKGFGTVADGQMGPNTIRAMQRCLNAGKF